MLDNETIRALELCMGNGNCDMCPEKTSTSKCINNLMKDALELINSQKALIKRLTSGKCVYLSDDETTEYCVEGPCPNYKTEAEIKAEAYKEFAEKVKQGFFSNSEQDVLICGVVDNILKEMAGEN